MTTSVMLGCDSCGRNQEVRSEADVTQTQGQRPDPMYGWGSLLVGGAKRDICPTCIAKLGGWGTNGVRAVRMETA